MMSSQLDHLANVLNPTEIEDLKAHASRAQEITTMKTRTAQKDRLLKKSISPKRDNRNLSSKKVSPNEEAVQKKWINFAVSPEQIPVDDIIEGGLQGLTGSDVDKARLKIAGVPNLLHPTSPAPFKRPLMT